MAHKKEIFIEMFYNKLNCNQLLQYNLGMIQH